jgi:ABC-type transport system substrate-binding protein
MRVRLPVLFLLSVVCQGPALAAAQTPTQGGTLVVAITADPGHLNPAITTGGATHAASELLYNGLLGRDEWGNPLPELAESSRGVPNVSDGVRLAIDFVHFPTFARYGELLRQQLGAVGIAVSLRPLEPAVFAPTVFKERDFDTSVISYCNGPDPEIGVRRMYHSSQIGPAPFTNAAAYRNTQVDTLLDQAGRTADGNERRQLYRQLQEIVVQELPYYWLTETLSTRVWSARCTGFKPWTGLFAEAAWCRPEGVR